MAIGNTNNYGFPIINTGDEVGLWGADLNNGTFTPLDAILGGFLPVSISAVDISLSNPNFQNAGFILTGALTGNRNLITPLSPNTLTPTIAAGGKFVVVNNTSGAFSITVKTAASGSTGVVVPQGFAVELFADPNSGNVFYAENGLPGFAQASAGNPNGLLGGTAASVNTNASLAYDYVNGILYVCTLGGAAGTAVWTNPVSGSLPQPAMQGYLTPTSFVPIITGDVVGSAANSVYYTPFVGSWAAIHNGTQIIPYRFTQLPFALSPSQASGQIYDIYLCYNGGTPVIGTGPSWAAGSGGSVTPGSCARGTGAGGAAIQRDASTGLWVNTASMSVIWNIGAGNNTITVAAGQGVFLGSIYVDATSGQVSCYRSYGQNRKFGISNAYNRQTIELLGGSGVASWNYLVANVWRQSNADTGNKVTTFCCLAEEEIDVTFSQLVTGNQNGLGSFIGIGINTTTNANGFFNAFYPSSVTGNASARVVQPPQLGVNVFNMVELTPNTQGSGYFGTNTNMLMVASYRG